MKRKMFLIGTMALMFASGIFWSCQKDEFEIDSENELMLKNGKIDVRAELVFSPESPVCLNTEVTVTAKAWNGNEPAGGGKIQIEEFVNGSWTQIVNFVDLPGFAEFKFTPTETGNRTFRANYVGGSGYSNAKDEKTIEFKSCGCSYEGNLLTGEAISCDETREAVYIFSSELGAGPFKIQGGLTNFTGENATVYINGELVVFDETSSDNWMQGTTENGFKVGQRTPGSGSNRNIRVEGSLDECSAVVIRIVWNSENGGSVITGDWSVVGDGVGEVAPVPGLTCTE